MPCISLHQFCLVTEVLQQRLKTSSKFMQPTECIPFSSLWIVSNQLFIQNKSDGLLRPNHRAQTIFMLWRALRSDPQISNNSITKLSRRLVAYRCQITRAIDSKRAGIRAERGTEGHKGQQPILLPLLFLRRDGVVGQGVAISFATKSLVSVSLSYRDDGAAVQKAACLGPSPGVVTTGEIPGFVVDRVNAAEIRAQVRHEQEVKLDVGSRTAWCGCTVPGWPSVYSNICSAVDEASRGSLNVETLEFWLHA